MILELILDPQVPLPPCLSQGGDIKANEITSEEADCETMAADRSSLGSIEISAQMIDQLPRMESIGKFIVSLSIIACRLPNQGLLKKEIERFVKGSSLLITITTGWSGKTFE